MAYYPKNKIKTGLFAQPGIFVYSSNLRQQYSGPYWSRADGKYFAGDSPDSAILQEIIMIISVDTSDSPGEPPLSGDYSPMMPTEEDYKFGEFTRYFTKRVNQPIFVEVSKDTYNEYVDKKTDKIYALYQPFNLKWVLTGNFDDVYRANKTYVLLKEQSDKVVGLKEYLLENYTQYYK
jgi:hypothetical protein